MERIETSLLTMVIPHNVKTGEILLLNRPQERGFPGYIGAGGKIEINESFTEGAVRELYEETGLEALPEDLIYKGVDEFIVEEENYRYIVFNYVVEKYKGTLLHNAPEGKLKWVNLKEAKKLPMQSWFERRLPYFFHEGTFEISVRSETYGEKPYKENVRRVGVYE